MLIFYVFHILLLSISATTSLANRNEPEFNGGKLRSSLLKTLCDCSKVFQKEKLCDSVLVTSVDVKISEAPWHVSLFFDDTLLCGGTLISSTWIVTAAHCIYNRRGFPVDRWSLVIGIDNLYGENVVRYKFKRFILHKMFDRPFYSNDIALIELNSSLNFIQHNAQPIALAKGCEHVNDKPLLVYGFGKTEKHWYSPTLKRVRVFVVDNIQCQKFYCVLTKSSEQLPIYKSNFCAEPKNGEFDVCNGDSGGGLIFRNGTGKNVLFGIVSHGEDCSLEYRPTIYTRISSYIDWISFNSKISIHGQPIPNQYIYNKHLEELVYDCPFRGSGKAK